MLYLVQISDPHFGNHFSNEGVTKTYLLREYNAHSFKLCRQLMSSFNDGLAAAYGMSGDEPLYLVMNGDLTALGRSSEFEVGNTFIFSQHAITTGQIEMPRSRNLWNHFCKPLKRCWEILKRLGKLGHGKNNLAPAGRLQRVGLQQAESACASIPGNHDHWKGWRIWPFQLGYSTETYRHFPDRPPFVKRFVEGEVELCLFAIDSATMFAERRTNFSEKAGGGFSRGHRREFETLVATELSKPKSSGCKYRTAAILCHHPFTSDNLAAPLCPACTAWLTKLACQYNIRMILTGHTHSPFTDSYNVTGSGSVREVRCPTTLQGPPELNESQRSPGFWLHRISVENGRIVWRGDLLLFSEAGFILDRERTMSGISAHLSIFEDSVPDIP
jgi:hypothetical protein